MEYVKTHHLTQHIFTTAIMTPLCGMAWISHLVSSEESQKDSVFKICLLSLEPHPQEGGKLRFFFFAVVIF